MKNKEIRITSLNDRDAVRQSTAMYLGDTDNGDALIHTLYEALDNSIDEYFAGYCNKIIITIHKDGSLSIFDNGRGIPIYFDKNKNMNAMEMVFCLLHAGSKFDKQTVSSGLHGVGISCVNFVSNKLKVIVYRDNKEYSMIFEKGLKVQDLEEKPTKHKGTGTLIRFAPDLTIFKNIIKFDINKIKERLRNLSFLCSGLEIHFADENTDESLVFSGTDGVAGFVKYLAKEPLLGEPIFFAEEKDNISVDMAFQWVESGSETEISYFFTNNIRNIDGGSHMVGFRTGLTRTINTFVSNSDLAKTLKITLSGEDIREGLISIISIRHPKARYSSQTKDKLVSEDARTVVDSVVSSNLVRFLEQNPVIAKKIVTRCVNSFKAREAARRAKEAIRKTILKDGVGVLPGKLADCSCRDPNSTELFIVEGQSAGGCFFGSTMIALPNGSEISFENLVKEYKNGKVYNCYTMDNGEVHISKIENPRKTKSNAKVIKIVLDNGYEEICTPDHKLMLLNGEYVEAKDSLNVRIKSLDFMAKIVKIIELEEKMDVYDLEVPGTHNFALSSGIFVHNSAKMGRNREFQAILPLRGKVLNVEKSEYEKMLKNEELTNLVSALGTGFGKAFDINKLRYGKVILFTDSDVDGSHIRALLLTFFFRQLPQLILNGNLYIARPPLFKVSFRGKSQYLRDDKELKGFIKKNGINQESKGFKVQRFKGLGEMNPEDLWETSMDPLTREVSPVVIENLLEAEKIFNILMGSQVEPRRDFLIANASFAKLDV